MMATAFDPDFASTSDHAQMLRSLGLQVVPGHDPSSTQNWKRPLLSSWREFENALVPAATFDQWFGTTYRGSNIGIITGACSNNVFVVDLDIQRHAAAGEWWQAVTSDEPVLAPTQRTGGGGLQILLRAPDGWTPPTAKTAAGVDIRGQGGFAVVPPSRHESGGRYAWIAGREPWVLAIPTASEGLCAAIDHLVGPQPASQANTTTATVKTASASAGELDAFGNRVDGREDYMTRLVWAKVLDLYRECPFQPSADALQNLMRETYETYLRNVKSRIQEPGTAQHILLEREGRGHTLMQQKWRAALQQWDHKIAQEAAKPYPKGNSGQEHPVSPPRIDYETGEVLSTQDDFTSDVFELLDVRGIKALSDPTWLVEGMIVGPQSLGFITGAPGSGKSFICLGMAMAIALKQPTWMDRTLHVPENAAPVIYLSSEGVSDIKNRIRAIEIASSLEADDAPFYLGHSQINLSAETDILRLQRAVQLVVDRHSITPALIVVDTLARAMAGDENSQEDANVTVRALDLLRETFQCVVLCVHHSSKAGETMRGSSVFSGAADFIFEVRKEPGATDGTLTAAKIKAAQDGWILSFNLRSIALGDLRGTQSLVAEASRAPVTASEQKVDLTVIHTVLKAMQAAWDAGASWNPHPRSRTEGRYAVVHMVKAGIPAGTAQTLLEDWLHSGQVVLDIADRSTKQRGLRVVDNTAQVVRDWREGRAETQNWD